MNGRVKPPVDQRRVRFNSWFLVVALLAILRFGLISEVAAFLSRSGIHD